MHVWDLLRVRGLRSYFYESMIVLSNATVRVLVYNAGPQIFDQLHIDFGDDRWVLGKKMFCNNDSKFFDGGKLMATRQNVNRIFDSICGDDISVICLCECLVHPALSIVSQTKNWHSFYLKAYIVA